MPETCETIKIMTENGPVEINRADYDPAKHKLAADAPAPQKRGRK